MTADSTAPAEWVLMAVDGAIREALEHGVAERAVPLDADPVAAMRALLRSNGHAWRGIQRVIVSAACEPLEAFPDGAVFEAADYINVSGDNPAIGMRPSSHHAFFLDMHQPFATGWWGDTFHAVTLAGWSARAPLDDAARRDLRALGASVASVHGVPQAIAARSLGVACTALFYAAGDSTGMRAVARALEKAVMSPGGSVQSLSKGVSNPYHILVPSYPRSHHTH